MPTYGNASGQIATTTPIAKERDGRAAKSRRQLPNNAGTIAANAGTIAANANNNAADG
jgi:hypothetical protein